MAMCTNKNKTLFWPACVRVCEHHTHFICMFSFYYWHSCRFFCLHIHIFIYTYTLRVCVHILLLLLLYIYIYILSVFWLTEYEHVPLTIKNLHRTYALWLSFGLVGRQPFFITLLHAFLTVFSISLSRSFLSFLRGREIHGARVATNSN